MRANGTLYLRAEITPPDETGCWTVIFPEINVGSQGETLEIASKNANIALSLCLESCVEAGTLKQALLECGVEPHRIQQIEREVSRGFVPPTFMEATVACPA